MSSNTKNPPLAAGAVFKPDDFESTKFVVHFVNLTTQMEVKADGAIQITEVAPRSLVLELPARSCAKGQSAMVHIFRAKNNSKKTTPRELIVSATGKISEAEISEEKGQPMRITFEMLQFDEESWDRFLQFFSNRQAEIEAFFKSVKGY